MVDCEIWKGEKQITLQYNEQVDLSSVEFHPGESEEQIVSKLNQVADLDDTRRATRCLKALKELEPIIQPLSVEFVVKYRNKKTLALKRDYRDFPEFPYWHWEISSIPPEIVTEGFYPDGAKVIPVENITVEDLSKWIVEPLQQKSPDPEYEVRWTEMNICATRARVIDEIRFAGRDYYLVKTKIGEYKYPLIKHDGGLWVYGPKEPYRSYPPMTIMIYTEGATAHEINFSIPWTVWYLEDTPEYYYFYQAVQRIIAQGWQLSEYTPMKEPKYAA